MDFQKRKLVQSSCCKQSYNVHELEQHFCPRNLQRAPTLREDNMLAARNIGVKRRLHED